MKSKSEFIMREFKFIIPLPEFYKAEPELVETLKYCLENKQANPNKIKQVSQ
jgi:hypothetical protein